VRNQRIVRGHEHVRKRCRLSPIQPGRFSHQCPLIDTGELRLRPSAMTHHGITDLPARDAGTEGIDLTRALDTTD
jgi:hypothetical protein